ERELEIGPHRNRSSIRGSRLEANLLSCLNSLFGQAIRQTAHYLDCCDSSISSKDSRQDHCSLDLVLTRLLGVFGLLLIQNSGLSCAVSASLLYSASAAISGTATEPEVAATSRTQTTALSRANPGSFTTTDAFTQSRPARWWQGHPCRIADIAL